MRSWINLVEGALRETAGGPLETVIRNKGRFLSSRVSFDSDAVADILELDPSDTDETELADQWFDVMVMKARRMQEVGKFPVYRNMNVVDFEAYVQALEAGQATTGECWSLSYGIETPMWDQTGDVNITLEGLVSADTVDWEATFLANFEYPREEEVIFSGPIHLVAIVNRDTDETYQPQKTVYPR